MSIHTRNVTRVFREATDTHRAAGIGWYATARETAQDMASTHGVTLECAVGVIAALSPLMSWGTNVMQAKRALTRRDATGLGLGRNCDKADRIIAGAAPLDVLGGPKVRAFYRLILTAGAAPVVCIDRHATDISYGIRHTEEERPSATGKRYHALAETYVRAAKILSREFGFTIHPCEVQAVTWLAWRRKFWAAGAWDGNSNQPTLTFEEN